MTNKNKPIINNFTVNLSKWHRGKGYGSKLYRLSDGKMCCLGFYALACGYQVSNIIEVPSPEVVADTSKFPPTFFENFRNSFSIIDIMETNDSQRLLDIVRRELLEKRFLALGIKINYQN